MLLGPGRGCRDCEPCLERARGLGFGLLPLQGMRLAGPGKAHSHTQPTNPHPTHHPPARRLADATPSAAAPRSARGAPFGGRRERVQVTESVQGLIRSARALVHEGRVHLRLVCGGFQAERVRSRALEGDLALLRAAGEAATRRAQVRLRERVGGRFSG